VFLAKSLLPMESLIKRKFAPGVLIDGVVLALLSG